MNDRSCAIAVGILMACVVVSAAPYWDDRGGAVALSRQSAVGELLTDYERGEFEPAVQQAAKVHDVEAFSKELQVAAPVWAELGGPASVARRRLVAATFVLEVTHAFLDDASVSPSNPAASRLWRTYRTMIEWACAFLRAGARSSPAEKTWFLASIALARATNDRVF